MTIEQKFQQLYGNASSGTAFAHGRVNLIGEHVDYNGGMVLPMAIHQKAQIALASGEGDVDVVHSDYFNASIKRPIHAPADGHWSDYVIGALQKARDLGVIEGGMRVCVESDIPAGAGLSSSAAVIVATLKAVLNSVAKPIDNREVSQWAQQVEHHYIGMPCGIMDQMAVAIASDARALAINTSTLAYDLIDLPNDYRFAVIHSGVTRKLDDGRYAERRHECDAAGALLGTKEICLATDARAIDRLPEPLMRRARHVYSEHHRVLAAIDALKLHDMVQFGQLMRESHNSMRDDFEISTLQIDALVKGAEELGAIGARLTGGGFGGCIVACVASPELKEWRLALEKAFPNARTIA